MNEAKELYEKQKPKKWIIVAIGIVAAIALGYWIPWMVAKATNASYSRASLDVIMK